MRAKWLAESVDFKSSGMIVVLGLVSGTMCGALVERIRGRATIVVFEPDVALLRSVMERVDCSFLARPDVVVTTDHENLGAISRSLVGHEPLLAMGTVIIEHAPSRSRLVDTAPKFARALTEYVGTVRMHMITTLVHSDVTVRNMLMNLDHYVEPGDRGPERCRGGQARRGGLCGSEPAAESAPAGAAGRAGSRGDHRGADGFEADAGGRDQAALRDGAGLPRDQPDGFTEGLSAADVEGVTLVAEPKVNAAVLEAWPGAKRMPSDDFLATMLGDSLGGERGAIRAGATVAHLSYYLARHMGCDPVILIGQDLGFTDGQYYSKGAAIHDVWAGELNAFNTLEMMEWQRIVRNRGHLHKAEDHLGREIYTDEQMRTYLGAVRAGLAEDCKHGAACDRCD
ncbi:MAG: 6-hydroxymethylpterin diphosphokinase MptE-like protein [Phycisphaerales bacterium]